VGEGGGDHRGHLGRTRGVAPRRHGDRAADLAEVVERAVRIPVVEDPRFGLWGARQLDPVAVGRVAQAVVDVGPQRVRGEGVERRLRREVGVGGLAVGEPWAPPARGPGQRVGAIAAALDRREHDGLVEPHPGERARPSLLGHEQGGAAHRVPDGHHVGQPEVVDDGEHVVAHAAPREVARGGRRALPVAAEVERPGVGDVRELVRHRRPGHGQETGRMAQEQGLAVAAEVVQRERHAIGRGHRARRRGGDHRPMLAADVDDGTTRPAAIGDRPRSR
jgi:hypothetical protein